MKVFPSAVLSLLVSIALFVASYPSAALAESDSTIKVRIGYLNLAKLKSVYKPYLDADALKTNRTNELAKMIDDGNARLQEASKTMDKAQVKGLAETSQIEINNRKGTTDQEVQEAYRKAYISLAALAKNLAERFGLDMIVDGACVYAGGVSIVDNGVDVTTSLEKFITSGSLDSVTLNKTATAISTRIARFDLNPIRTTDPALIEAEASRIEAERQLLKMVSEDNAKLTEAQSKKLPKPEIDAMARQFQAEINATQRALIDLVQAKGSANNRKLAEVVSNIADRKHIDIALEEAGILYGGDKIVGPRITKEIQETMQPGFLVSGSTTPSTKTETSSVATSAVKNDVIRDKWAVVIGISQFANPAYNLKYSAKDAIDFRNYLVNEARFSPDHVLTLVDRLATRANIMRAFGSKWLPMLSEQGDLVVIYISTHGTPSTSDSGGRNYIVAYDTDVNDLYATGVDMDELARRIKEIQSDRALIILDTCFSGAGIPGSRGLGRFDSFDISKIEVGRGQVVISASSPNERSWESRTSQNGVFTRHLIDSLRAGSLVDVRQAFNKCLGETSWEVKRDQGVSQTPQIGGNWSGKPLVLSLPASRPRQMSRSKLEDFGLSKDIGASKDQLHTTRPAVHKLNH